MNLDDAYRYALADFNGNEFEMLRHNKAVAKACNLIFDKLGNPANIEWMKKPLEEFGGFSFDQIRFLHDATRMETLLRYLEDGRIKVE